MNVARVALRNDKVIVFAVLVLALLGVRAYLNTPQSIFPTMSFSRINVVAEAGDLPPDQVRIAVTRPLEGALQTLPSVTNVIATSSQGSAELNVSFAGATDPQTDLQLVNAAIAQLRSDVPLAKTIVANVVNPNREPVLSYALTSRTLSQTVLRDIATATILPALYGTPGLGRVLVTGGPTSEYHVRLDPARLQASGIGAGDVTRALADANTVVAVGEQQQHYQRYAVLLDASLHDVASLGSVAIATKNGGSVPLASLGTIAPGVSPITDQTSINGTHAVLINAYGLPGADTVRMAAAFRARLDAARLHVPRTVEVTLFWDQTTLIVASQSALRDAILLGALLAIVVIYAFLRSFRLTLVAAAVIPLAMAIAIFGLQLAGQTLNLMSVGGLAVAVGLIIDDAIVVIENIARNQHARPDLPIEATIELSMAQLTGAMVASTTTTVVVFLPLALLTGVSGFFFRALAFTLSTSLIVSLALALFVAPIVARALLARDAKGHEPRRDAIAAVLERYAPLLRWSLRHRVVVGLGSIAALAVTILLLARLPSDFLPKMDEGQFEIAYTMPTGITLAASDAAATQMERVLVADPAVAGVGRLTGVDSNGVTPTQPNSGLLRVRLVPASQRAGYEEVSARLRGALGAAVPASILDFHQILEDLINDLSGSPAPIEISVRGNDQATLITLAQTITDAIGKVPGVVDTASGVVYDNPSLRIAPRGAALAAQGLSSADVGDALAALAQGTVATSIPGTQRLVPVRVLVGQPGSAHDDVIGGSSPLYAKGSAAAVGALASVTPMRLASDITTVNGQLQIRITANFENASLSAVTAGIRRVVRGISLPPGYTTELGGQAQTQSQSFSEFVSVIGIAVALVFAVILATFRSFRLPLVILTAIPLALVGVALGLAVTGTHVNVSSFMGLLLLVGVVVKNGILLIDVANRRRAEGASVEEALVTAGSTRLRPIVMTTLAAIGGLFPLALGIGQGAEMEKPLAIAVIGGLSTATIFTLVVIPVLYAAFMGRVRVARVVATVCALAICTHASLVIAAPSAPTVAAPQTQAFAKLSLADALAAADAHSPDIAAAQARYDQSRYAFLVARDALAPALLSSYVQVPQGNPPGPNLISRQVTLGLQWTLGDFLGFAPATREAALTLASSEFDRSAAVASERVKVVGLYYDALKARAVAQARRGALDLARRQRSAAQVRVAAGDAPQLDVVRADVAVARAEADDELARAADENTSEALRVEVAASDEVTAATQPTAPSALDPRLSDPQTVAGLARRLRPEIASAQRLRDAADAAVRSARAAGFPIITFGAGYLLGTDSDVPIHAPTITANATLPLSRGAHDRVGIAVAKALEAQAKAASIERQIVLDASASARTLGAAERAAAATTRARQAAETEVRALDLGYRSGASSSADLAIVRATYAQAIVDELSALYDVEKARAQLEIEVGRT